MATTFVKHLRAFCRDESGASALEYVMIAAAVSILIIAMATTIGGSLAGLLQSTSSE